MPIASVLLLMAGGVFGGMAMLTLRRWSIRHPAPHSLIIEQDDADLERRILKLEGAANFRDIGGYVTADGRRVRWGRVYRSGALAKLTDTDIAVIERLNLRLVCDLRSGEEVNYERDRLPQGAAYLHLPINTEESPGDRLRALLFQPDRLGTMLQEMYKGMMLEENSQVFGEMLRRMAEADNLPILIHCTAGKDRTGLTIALLLSVLGVPEETILADYTLSNLYYENYYAYAKLMMRRVRWLGLRADDLQPLLVANADNLRAALVYLREKYGSIENYLQSRAGVDEATIAQLKANLLE